MAAAGGDADHAVRLMLADKMEELMRIQVDAVKGIKIDKVTVWDGGEQKDGKTATAGFVSGLMKSIPPMNEMFDMAGMELPRFLGKNKEEPAAPAPPQVGARPQKSLDNWKAPEPDGFRGPFCFKLELLFGKAHEDDGHLGAGGGAGGVVATASLSGQTLAHGPAGRPPHKGRQAAAARRYSMAANCSRCPRPGVTRPQSLGRRPVHRAGIPRVRRHVGEARPAGAAGGGFRAPAPNGAGQPSPGSR